ncbi:hypothetical protein D3Z36_14885 [Lachnospiraceae bacterium]|nr:hypothetical protein [Lachnospiraceae bacterium]
MKNQVAAQYGKGDRRTVEINWHLQICSRKVLEAAAGAAEDTEDGFMCLYASYVVIRRGYTESQQNTEFCSSRVCG